jgi:hypothetical protein
MASFPSSTPPATRRYLGLGAASVCLGVGGLAFAFLAPFGALLAACGLICGIIGLILAAPGRRGGFWWSLWGTVLSGGALLLDIGLTDFGTIHHWFSGMSFWIGG